MNAIGIDQDVTAAIAIDPLTDPRWAALVSSRDASLFSSPEWLGVLADVYGFAFEGRGIGGADALDAAVAICHINDPRGSRIVSLPFCDLNDPVVDSPEDWELLTEGLFGDTTPVVFRTRGHEIVSADSRLETETVGVWHELDATVPPEEAQAGFATLPRRMIRRAARDGLVVERSTSQADLRAFYDLHVGVRKHRHHLLPQPWEFFEAIGERFLDTGNGAVVGARVDGEFVGGCLLLEHGDTAFYKFSASHPDYRSSGVSHATLFEGYRYAHEKGLRAYDLGRSDLDTPGLVDFKRRFRPRELPLTVHRYRPPHPKPDLLGPTLSELTALLVGEDIPESVSAEAGRLLYKFFA